MVYTLTTDLTTTPQSVLDLLVAGGYIFSGGQLDRVSWLIIQWIDGTPFVINNKVDAAGRRGFALDTTNRLFELDTANANQISLEEICLVGGAATDSVRIFAMTV